MDVIMKLEKSMIEDGYIKGKLSEFFNQDLHYMIRNCCNELTEKSVIIKDIDCMPEVVETAKLLKAEDRKIIVEEQELNVKDLVKMSFLRTRQERKEPYLVRRKRRRQEFRKRKKIKKGKRVLDVEEEKHKISAKMKKPQI
jgi:hypothetical protein